MALFKLYGTQAATGPLGSAIVTIWEADRIQAVLGSLTIDLWGDFTYEGETLVDGTLKGLDLYDAHAGGLQYTFTGLQAGFWEVLSSLIDFGMEDAWKYLLAGGDTIEGTSRAELLDGLAGPDLIDGGGGNDTLVGWSIDGFTGRVDDTLVGGAGDDVYFFGIPNGRGPVPDFAVDATQMLEGAGGGYDVVFSQWDITVAEHIEKIVATGSDVRRATGNSGANLMIAEAGGAELFGLGGDDTLQGGGALHGGAGNDLYLIEFGHVPVVEMAGEGVDTVHLKYWDYVMPQHVEHLVVAEGSNARLVGNDLANDITGNDFANVLDGGGGADTLRGGSGNDVFILDDRGDLVVDRGGNDTIQTSLDGFVLGAGVENLTLTAGAVRGEGNEAANGLLGNEAANLLVGHGGDDFLEGAAGDDLLVGGAGNDIFVLEAQGDVVIEESAGGHDTVWTAVSRSIPDHVEVLAAGRGDIDLTGSDRADVLLGGYGTNRLAGGRGSDTLDGGGGGDVYVIDDAELDVIIDTGGAYDGDVIEATVDIDMTTYRGIATVFLLGQADLKAVGNEEANLLFGNAGHNLLVGVNGDHLDGAAGNDTLVGQAGSDTLVGGAGADAMAGGAGDDLYHVHDGLDSLSESAGGGLDTVWTWVDFVLPREFERLIIVAMTGPANGTGSADGNQFLQGNDLANRLHGGGGDGDTLVGGYGDDVLFDDGGAARLIGGHGSDTYHVTNAGTTYTDEGGWDVIVTSLAGPLPIDFEGLVVTAGIDVTGNAKNNELTGNAANNVLRSGGGVDTMRGGAGDDLYVIGSRRDRIVEEAGGGADTVETGGLSYSIAGTAVESILLGDTHVSDASATGNEEANQLRGTGGNNLLDGGAGADTMAGLAGDDTYVVDDAADQVHEDAGAGIDTVRTSLQSYLLPVAVEGLELLQGAVAATGNAADNVLRGNAAANELRGEAGHDTLWGAGGADTLAGGAGNDSIDGDAGADVALYGGARAGYTITSAFGHVTVTGPEGIDVLTGVEVLRFTDQDVVLAQHPVSGLATISGEAVAGHALVARAEGLADADGLGSLSGQWFRDGRPIAGATSAVYVPGAEDVGATLSVRGSYVDGQGHLESFWSALTAPVISLDRTAPVLLAASPGHGAPVTGLVLRYTFDEPVRSGGGVLTIRQGQDIVETIALDDAERVVFEGATLEVRPSLLQPLTDYTAGWDEGAIEDAFGNPYGNQAIGFSTGGTRVIVGTAGDDHLTGSSGDNHVSGLAGNDTLAGGHGGHDTLVGGEGRDTGHIAWDPQFGDVLSTTMVVQGDHVIHLDSIERLVMGGSYVALDTTVGTSYWQALALTWVATGTPVEGLALSEWIVFADRSGGLADVANTYIEIHAPGVADTDLVAFLFLRMHGEFATQEEIAAWSAQIGAGLAYETQGDFVAMALHEWMDPGILAPLLGGPRQLEPSPFF